MGKDLKQSFSSSYWGIVIASTLGLTVLLFFVADRSQTFAEGSAAVRPRVHLPLVIRPQAEAAVAPQGWLGSVNHYRAMANLPPLTENKSWSDGARKHARYIVKNDTLEHGEDPNNEWYTPEGHEAAQSSNLMMSSNMSEPDEAAVDLWIQSPFHALGILRPALSQTGFGSYREDVGEYKMAAVLDVLRGIATTSASVAFPVAWPGDGATVSLRSYNGGEYPDPLASCPGYSVPTGLPILLQFGSGSFNPKVTAHSITRDGVPIEHCVYDEESYTHSDGSQEALGRSILDSNDAIVLIPREPLVPGARYTVSVTANGRTHTWSFRVSDRARLEMGTESEQQLR